MPVHAPLHLVIRAGPFKLAKLALQGRHCHHPTQTARPYWCAHAMACTRSQVSNTKPQSAPQVGQNNNCHHPCIWQDTHYHCCCHHDSCRLQATDCQCHRHVICHNSFTLVVCPHQTMSCFTTQGVPRLIPNFAVQPTSTESQNHCTPDTKSPSHTEHTQPWHGVQATSLCLGMPNMVARMMSPELGTCMHCHTYVTVSDCHGGTCHEPTLQPTFASLRESNLEKPSKTQTPLHKAFINHPT